MCAETRSPVAHLGWYHMQLRMGGSRASSSPGLGRQGRAALLDDAVLESDPGRARQALCLLHSILFPGFQSLPPVDVILLTQLLLKHVLGRKSDL